MRQRAERQKGWEKLLSKATTPVEHQIFKSLIQDLGPPRRRLRIPPAHSESSSSDEEGTTTTESNTESVPSPGSEAASGDGFRARAGATGSRATDPTPTEGSASSGDSSSSEETDGFSTEVEERSETDSDYEPDLGDLHDEGKSTATEGSQDTDASEASTETIRMVAEERLGREHWMSRKADSARRSRPVVPEDELKGMTAHALMDQRPKIPLNREAFQTLTKGAVFFERALRHRVAMALQLGKNVNRQVGRHDYAQAADARGWATADLHCVSRRKAYSADESDNGNGN